MIVAIETATEIGGIALVDSGRVLAERVLGADEQPAGLLLPALDALLLETGRSLADDDPVALSIGPGSFTGLRIGLATALGLCFGIERRLIPVPTLAALSLRAQPAERVVPLLDARRGQVYAGVYGPGASPLAEDRLCDPESLLRSLQGGGPVCLLGSGAELYRDPIRTLLGDAARLLPAERGQLRAGCVGLLGERLAATTPACAPEAVELCYLRRSQAEPRHATALLDTPPRNP